MAMSAETQPFIPSSGTEGVSSENSMAGCDFENQKSGSVGTAVEVNGCAVAENTSGPIEKYLKEPQSDHAKLSEVAKTVEFQHTVGLVELEMKNLSFNLKKQGIFVSDLPASKGPVVTLLEKLMIPMDNPEYNFVGPRGMLVKKLEQETGCNINVKGRGTKKEGNGQNKTDTGLKDETDDAEEREQMPSMPIISTEMTEVVPGERKIPVAAAVAEPVLPVFPQRVSRNGVVLVLENDGTGPMKKTQPQPIPSGRKPMKQETPPEGSTNCSTYSRFPI